ncbi:MAG: hypothetical protein KDJ41_04140 [Hyphomicrobiaceae bacterium]|nr:hypothetical protein [Hyphomicrobiaceae bacterium]
MNRQHINPFHWHQSIGYARQSCAQIFRDGGAPTDALKAYGITPEAGHTVDWSEAVEMIADRLCAREQRLAA